MSLSDLLKATGATDALKTGGVALIILCTLAQIAPIKLNPWTWLWGLVKKIGGTIAKHVGRGINAEVMTKLGGIEERLDVLEKNDQQQDSIRAEDKALDARRRIIQFGDEIKRKVRHSEERFNSILEDTKFYKDYCKAHPEFENDKAKFSTEIIEETYKKCFRENDFL